MTSLSASISSRIFWILLCAFFCSLMPSLALARALFSSSSASWSFSSLPVMNPGRVYSITKDCMKRLSPSMIRPAPIRNVAGAPNSTLLKNMYRPNRSMTAFNPNSTLSSDVMCMRSILSDENASTPSITSHAAISILAAVSSVTCPVMITAPKISISMPSLVMLTAFSDTSKSARRPTRISVAPISR